MCGGTLTSSQPAPSVRFVPDSTRFFVAVVGEERRRGFGDTAPALCRNPAAATLVSQVGEAQGRGRVSSVMSAGSPAGGRGRFSVAILGTAPTGEEWKQERERRWVGAGKLEDAPVRVCG